MVVPEGRERSRHATVWGWGGGSRPRAKPLGSRELAVSGMQKGGQCGFGRGHELGEAGGHRSRVSERSAAAFGVRRAWVLGGV